MDCLTGACQYHPRGPRAHQDRCSNTAAQAADGSGKRNSNCEVPTDGQTVSPSPPSDPDSDVVLLGCFGESDDNSYYVESAKKSPTILANMPYLAGHIIKLKEMH